MILIYNTFASFFLLAFAFLLSLNLHGQELPGTSLPGAAQTVSSQDKADKTEQPEVEKLDPVTVKELQDVVRTNIFAVSKRNINMFHVWIFSRYTCIRAISENVVCQRSIG